MGLLLLGALTAWGKEYNPHRQAERCRQQWKPGCEKTCSVCHESPAVQKNQPVRIDEYYPELSAASAPDENWGDLPLCLTCHPEHGASGDTMSVSMLSTVEATSTTTASGNHPVDVLYPLHDPEYVADPQGSTIYCNETRTECWVYCTSCHDMHGPDGPLPQREICFDCHIK